MRFVGLAAAAAALVSGCVELAVVEPPLTPEARSTYRVTQVAIHVADDASIWWGEGERLVAEQQGIEAEDAESLSRAMTSPEGAEAFSHLLAERLVGVIGPQLSGVPGGSQPAQLAVVVTDLHVSSSAQQVVFGGAHGMVAVVQLFDLATGEALSPPQRLSGFAAGGGGIVGAIVDGTRADPIFRVADSFAFQAARWLSATQPVEIQLPVEANAEPLPPVPGPEPATPAEPVIDAASTE